MSLARPALVPGDRRFAPEEHSHPIIFGNDHSGLLYHALFLDEPLPGFLLVGCRRDLSDMTLAAGGGHSLPTAHTGVN